MRFSVRTLVIVAPLAVAVLWFMGRYTPELLGLLIFVCLLSSIFVAGSLAGIWWFRLLRLDDKWEDAVCIMAIILTYTVIVAAAVLIAAFF